MQESSRARTQKVCILLYHSIGFNKRYSTVKPSEFYRQMDYLRKNYEIVSLDKIIKFINGKIDLDKAVAITFDDGYYDNYVYAFPYFKKYRLPATIFITTGISEKFQNKKLFEGIILKKLGNNEIKKMSIYIDFGAHTKTHPFLDKISLKEAQKEIYDSKYKIEKIINKKIKYFAYPFFKYNNKIINLIKTLGFKAALNGPGLVRKGDNPFILKRVVITSSTNFFLFKINLTEYYEWKINLKKFLLRS